MAVAITSSEALDRRLESGAKNLDLTIDQGAPEFQSDVVTFDQWDSRDIEKQENTLETNVRRHVLNMSLRGW